MTAEQFENAAFYASQRAIYHGIAAVKIVGFSQPKQSFAIEIENGDIRQVALEAVELMHPDPLTILREILRRMNSATGEPTACRLDPDLLEQVKKLFEHEQV